MSHPKDYQSLIELLHDKRDYFTGQQRRVLAQCMAKREAGEELSDHEQDVLLDMATQL